MKKHLQDYIKVYDGVLDKPYCAEVVGALQAANWRKHEFYNTITQELHSYENDLSVTEGLPEYAEAITDKLWGTIKTYLNEIGAQDWYNGWSGYSQVRFNRYDEGTAMKLHCDHIHSLFDGERKGIPTLTLLGTLNEDYEGGEFLMWGDTAIEIPAGSVAVFPSNFLYPHQVDAVTKGVRHSYVSWVW